MQMSSSHSSSFLAIRAGSEVDTGGLKTALPSALSVQHSLLQVSGVTSEEKGKPRLSCQEVESANRLPRLSDHFPAELKS